MRERKLNLKREKTSCFQKLAQRPPPLFQWGNEQKFKNLLKRIAENISEN